MHQNTPNIKISKAAIKQVLQDAITQANANPQTLKDRLTVSHEFTTEHGALISDFSVIYTCPNSGIQIKHCDTMLWNDTDDIILNGKQAHEVAEFDNFKEFTNNPVMYLAGNAEWIKLDDAPLQRKAEKLSQLYQKQIKMADFLPDWQDMVVNKVQADYELGD